LTGAPRFNLLIVSADGRRIRRLAVPRWAAWAATALLVLLVATPLVVWTDYVRLVRQRAGLGADQGVGAEHARLLETVRRRLAEIQGEMASWRGVHARIWEPFGPESQAPGERTGVGGVGQPMTSLEGGPAGVMLQLEQLAAIAGDEGQKLRALETLMARAGRMLAALPSRWPVRGPVNSEFGRRLSPWTGGAEHHGGIDIAAGLGTPVRAPAPGTVALVGPAPDFGVTVIIDHGHEIKTLFGHLQKPLVTQGQRVERGQVIALSGNTGKSSGPHLHYEITVKGQPVNPRGFLWE
jgi:murein DD-endopeptidase MepM/ murein hydrolase activator NlpD